MNANRFDRVTTDYTTLHRYFLTPSPDCGMVYVGDRFMPKFEEVKQVLLSKGYTQPSD